MDPLVERVDAEGVSQTSVALDTDFGSFDAVVIVTDHSALDRGRLASQARLIIDTRDALHDVTCDRAKIYGL
jgi:UDP-N-acetyl-D-glucosamine dehydrogenase